MGLIFITASHRLAVCKSYGNFLKGRILFFDYPNFKSCLSGRFRRFFLSADNTTLVCGYENLAFQAVLKWSNLTTFYFNRMKFHTVKPFPSQKYSFFSKKTCNRKKYSILADVAHKIIGRMQFVPTVCANIFESICCISAYCCIFAGRKFKLVTLWLQ